MSKRTPRVLVGAVVVFLSLLHPAGAGDADSAQFRLDVIADPAPLAVGSARTFVVTVTNTGPDPGEAVLALSKDSDTITAGMTTEADGVPLPCDSSGCELGTLLAGEQTTVQLVVTPIRNGAHRPELRVTGDADDPEPADNVTILLVEAVGEDCTMTGTPSSDTLTGTPAADVICALGGNDVLTGAEESDTLYGGEGDDTLSGGTGDDTLDGGGGTDTVNASMSLAPVAIDLAAGAMSGEGTDALALVEDATGTSFDDVIRGGAAPAALRGGDGVDLLFAGSGGASMFGEGGEDHLAGAGAVDALDGGDATNTCVWGPEDAATACITPDQTDGNDADGPLDVKALLSLQRDSWSPVWQFNVRARVRIHRLWDRGYFLLHIDSKGGPEADYLGMVRGEGRHVVGMITSPRGARIRGMSAWRPNRGSAALRFPLERITIDPSRAYIRWWGQTLWVGRGCVRACLDRVPGSGAALVHPLPT